MTSKSTKSTEKASTIYKAQEDIFIEFFLNDQNLFDQCDHLLDPEHFTGDNQQVIKCMKEHNAEYGQLPDRPQIHARTGIVTVGYDAFDTSNISQRKWFEDCFNDFIKYNHNQSAVLDAASATVAGNYDIIPKLFEDASRAGLDNDMGLDWDTDATEVIGNLKARRGEVSTGFSELDHKMFGGFSRGELNFFIGVSGTGKSVFLANVGYTWQQQGLNVLYITLEMSREDVAKRLYMIHMDVSSGQVFSDPAKVNTAVQLSAKKSTTGKMIIHEMAGLMTSTQSIKSFIKRYEAQKNLKFDALVVDYMDIMTPNSKSVSRTEKYLVDEHIATELRELAKSENMLVLTASQANRNAMSGKEDIGFGNIAGGVSKINSADNILSIITNAKMKEEGKYQLELLKTRNSNGTGQRIDLKFNPDSLKVRDYTDEERAEMLLLEGKTPAQISKGKIDNLAEAQERRESLAKTIDSMNQFGGVK